MQQEIFPDEQKITKITPIFKIGDCDLISNYRPSSVLSSLSKIVEKEVILQLTELLNVKNVITSR